MNDEEKKFMESLAAITGAANIPEAARSALAMLFPKAEHALETYIPQDSSDKNERKRKHRISTRDYASGYFRLDPQPSSWSQSEIDLILNSQSPSEALEGAEKRIAAAPERDRPRLRRLFLEMLDGAFGPLRPFNLDWFRAIIEISPSYITVADKSAPFEFFFDNADRIRSILRHALQMLLPEGRAELLKMIIPQATDISVLCDLVRGMAGDRNPAGAKSERSPAAFGEETERIRDLLVQRIRTLATTNDIWSQALPAQLLWFWWGADLEPEVRAFTTETARTERGLRGLLDIAVGLVHSSEGDYERVNYGVWSKIVDLEELRWRATEVAQSSRIHEDRTRAQRFLAALDRGRREPD